MSSHVLYRRTDSTLVVVETDDFWNDLGMVNQRVCIRQEGRKDHRRSSSLTDVTMAEPPDYQPSTPYPPPYQLQPSQPFSAPVNFVHSQTLHNGADQDVEMIDVASSSDNIRHHPYHRLKARTHLSGFVRKSERRRNRSHDRVHAQHLVPEGPAGTLTMINAYGYPHAAEYLKAAYWKYDTNMAMEENAAHAGVQEIRNLEKKMRELGQQYKMAQVRMRQLVRSNPGAQAIRSNASRYTAAQRFQALARGLQFMAQNGWDHEKARFALCNLWNVSVDDAFKMFPLSISFPSFCH